MDEGVDRPAAQAAELTGRTRVEQSRRHGQAGTARTPPRRPAPAPLAEHDDGRPGPRRRAPTPGGRAATRPATEKRPTRSWPPPRGAGGWRRSGAESTARPRPRPSITGTIPSQKTAIIAARSRAAQCPPPSPRRRRADPHGKSPVSRPIASARAWPAAARRRAECPGAQSPRTAGGAARRGGERPRGSGRRGHPQRTISAPATVAAARWTPTRPPVGVECGAERAGERAEAPRRRRAGPGCRRDGRRASIAPRGERGHRRRRRRSLRTCRRSAGCRAGWR